MKKKLIASLLWGILTISTLTGCGQKTTPSSEKVSVGQEPMDNEAEKSNSEFVNAKNASIYVAGYEWGPGVSKVIVELSEVADEVFTEGAVIKTAEADRTVADVYLSDEKGNKVSEASNYVTIEMVTEYVMAEMFGGSPGSPFTFDFMATMQNKWSESYMVDGCFEAVIAGEKVKIAVVGDYINSRLSEAEIFGVRGEYTGEYKNPMTSDMEMMTLQYAAYEPEVIADGEKNPLIIWLHGQGEGGVDPEIAVLGNEVVALTRDDIQSYFTAGEETGAYVLAVQTPTYWMDGGDGTNSNGDLVSRYAEILMDTIKDYVDGNADIDTNRIYIGGCSNGGYMTMNMIVNYPDYFAAAYPNCEAYAYNVFERNEDGTYKVDVDPATYVSTAYTTDERWLTPEKINAIKDIPIWFVQSADDTTVLPQLFGLPTYQALLKAGAENCWYSYFETVEGTDTPNVSYMGHWSWIYTFNNQVTNVQDVDAILSGTKDNDYGFVATNNGGGTELATVDGVEYKNIFAWLNAQSK